MCEFKSFIMTKSVFVIIGKNQGSAYYKPNAAFKAKIYGLRAKYRLKKILFLIKTIISKGSALTLHILPLFGLQY